LRYPIWGLISWDPYGKNQSLALINNTFWFRKSTNYIPNPIRNRVAGHTSTRLVEGERFFAHNTLRLREAHKSPLRRIVTTRYFLPGRKIWEKTGNAYEFGWASMQVFVFQVIGAIETMPEFTRVRLSRQAE